ncbi:peptidoglycan glycosyltransferase, partial [Xanthomonas citri pv. citri]|nr:peptidoglycan glycosyltransferase [Xanthomonas citri pv. citri]
ASKILGFTGADNQGILGLEIEYDDVLKGTNGQILTLTDASGVEIEEKEVKRVEPVAGDDLYISIDYSIQSYATQLARTAYYSNQAKS